MRKSPREHLDEVEEMLLAASARIMSAPDADPVAWANAVAQVSLARVTYAQAFTALPGLEATAVLQGKSSEMMDMLRKEIERGD